MIKVNCETKDKLKLTDMVPFQGNLKKRTDQDIKALTESLKTEGLMMPFAIWKKISESSQELFLLDGHGRKEALIRMSMDDPEILEYQWPVIYIDAINEDDARKALLQITSQYGKVTKQGYKQFCVSIPDYKAPVIQKFIAKPVKTEKPMVKELPKHVILKIKVEREKLDQVKQVFKEFDFIELM
jgi:hypothetical protein